MFNLLSRVITLCLLVIPLVGGCAAVPNKMEPPQTLPKGQAIVFGKIDVFVDGEHVKMSESGGSDRLTIEFRQEESSEILEYKIGETGHFYWALAPGKYEVLGTRGYGGSGGFGLMLPLGQRIWLPFTVEPGKSTYIGDFTLELGKKTRPRQRLDDNHSEAIKEFQKRYPKIQLEHLNKVTKLAPAEPGTYADVTKICDKIWGKVCSSDNAGITPLTPDRFQGAVVASISPTLRWASSSSPDVKYDIAIYEAYDSKWRKVLLDEMTGKKRWRRGRLLTYSQGLSTPNFKPDISLQPDTTYLWSVRLRRGETVSTWAQATNTRFHPGAFWFFMVEQWEIWPDFTTPSK